jgi:hypothetical protein
MGFERMNSNECDYFFRHFQYPIQFGFMGRS